MIKSKSLARAMRKFRPKVSGFEDLRKDLSEYQKQILIDLYNEVEIPIEDRVELSVSLNQLAVEYLIERVWRQGSDINPVLTVRGKSFVRTLL